MQNLMTISLDKFKKEVYKIKSKDLYKLFQACRQLIRNRGDKMTDIQFNDLQRKMTAIERVLIYRRWHLNKLGQIEPDYFREMWKDLKRTQ